MSLHRRQICRYFLVECRSLPRYTPGLNSEFLQLPGIDTLAVAGACGSGNTFVDQRTAQIICAGMQTSLQSLQTHFDPGCLNILYVWVQHETCYCVHED